MTTKGETVPEKLLTDDTRFDAVSHDALPQPEVSHETAPGPVFGPGEYE